MAILLEMAAASVEHDKWERRLNELCRMYERQPCFVDRDGKWGLRDFLDYARAAMGYTGPSTYDHGKRDGIEAGAGELSVRLRQRASGGGLGYWHDGQWVDDRAVEADLKSAADMIDPAIRALSGEGREVAEDMVLIPRDELRRIRASMCLLQQNSEGCAQNHYGEDFSLFGMPGWLADTARDVAALTTYTPTPKPQIAPEMEPIPDSEEG